MLDLILSRYVDDPVNVLFDQSPDVHILQLVVLVGITDQKRIFVLQQIKIQLLDDPGKEFVGHIRYDHANAAAFVGP